ncbi:hypothetical protein GCM10018987_11650 [Streptomyces cremeus]
MEEGAGEGAGVPDVRRGPLVRRADGEGEGCDIRIIRHPDTPLGKLVPARVHLSHKPSSESVLMPPARKYPLVRTSCVRDAGELCGQVPAPGSLPKWQGSLPLAQYGCMFGDQSTEPDERK